MRTDWKALCAELLAALKSWSPSGGGPLEGKEAIAIALLINRVSTLLAQPEPEGPTDQELESVARAAEIQNMKEQGGLNTNDANGIAAQLQLQRLAGLRAVWARWGRPTPLPVAGEVAELVEWLTMLLDRSAGMASNYNGNLDRIIAILQQRHPAPQPPGDGEVGELVEWLGQLSEMACTAEDANRLDRIIALLECLAPQPVPVAERLPGPEDCDAEGRVGSVGRLKATGG